jgi:hypothetical protein
MALTCHMRSPSTLSSLGASKTEVKSVKLETTKLNNPTQTMASNNLCPGLNLLKLDMFKNFNDRKKLVSQA